MNEFFGITPDLKAFFGVVEDVNDPMKLGRARVRCFGIHPSDKTAVPTFDLPWATVMTPTTSASVSGIGDTPQLIESAWVFGFFLDGEKAQRPMVLGTLPGQHPANPFGYGGTGSPGEASGTSGQSDLPQGNQSTQHNAIRDSQNIRDDGSYLSRRDESSVRFRNYQLRDFGPGGQYNNPSFRIHKATAFALDTVATNMGRRLNVNSGWRTFGDPHRHPKGRAVDVSIRGMSPSDVYRMLNLAAQAGFVNFGIEWTYIHMDTTSHLPATLYAYGSQGAPRGSSAIFDSRTTTGNLQHAEIRRALESAGWRRGRTRPFELVRTGQGGSSAPAAAPTTQQPLSGDQASISGSSGSETLAGGSGSDQLGQSDSTRVGFRDPTNSYPTNDYRGSSSINIAARGVADDVGLQPASTREAGRVVNFPLPFGGKTFGEPAIPAASLYPYNHVRMDRSGNMIEMDSTPNAERLNIAHRKGSYMEFGPEGDVVNKSTGDMTQISGQNLYTGAKGNMGFSSAGDFGIKSGTSMAFHTDGNLSTLARGNQSQQVNGDYNLRVGGDLKIRGRNLHLEFDSIHLVANKDIFITSEGGSTQIYNGKGFKLTTMEGVDINVSKSLKLESESFDLISTKKVNIEGKEDINLKGDQKINIQGKGNINLKGDANINLQAEGSINAKSAENKVTPDPWLPGAGSAESAGSAATADKASKGQESDLAPTTPIDTANINNRPNTSRPASSHPTIGEAAARQGYGSGQAYTGDVNDRNQRPRSSNGNQSSNQLQNQRSPANVTGRANEAYNFFIEKGYTPAQASAIVSNLQAESGPNLNPNAVGDRGSAFGIMQWRLNRRTGLENFANDRGTSSSDFRTQLEYVNAELRGTDRNLGVGDAGMRRSFNWMQQNPNDPAAIAENLATNGIRPARQHILSGERQAGAQSIFDSQNNRNTAQGQSNPEQTEGQAFDTPQPSISPVRQRQQTEKNLKYNINTVTGNGLRNYLNTAPIREGRANFRIKKDLEDKVGEDALMASQKTGYPAEMAIQLASWDGDGTSVELDRSRAEEIGNDQIKKLPELEKAIETYPSRGEMFILYTLDSVSDAAQVIKNAKDKAKKDQEATVGKDEDKIKKDGPNKDKKRTWIELYNYYTSKIVDSQSELQLTSLRVEQQTSNQE